MDAVRRYAASWRRRENTATATGERLDDPARLPAAAGERRVEFCALAVVRTSPTSALMRTEELAPPGRSGSASSDDGAVGAS
jgi:hypothetical protein